MAAIKTLERYEAHLREFFEACKEEPENRLKTFRDRRTEVYMRCSWNRIEDEVYLCLDIARVEVWPQRKGTFSRMLQIAQDLCPWNAVRVESVGNPHLARYLRRLKDHDGRWVEDAACLIPTFVWFRDRDGEYTRVGVDEIETRALIRKRISPPSEEWWAFLKKMRMEKGSSAAPSGIGSPVEAGSASTAAEG